MRVERLELIGFKSFADKTVFKFHPGTTAIVGPNGCGKSNIVDAFKWVLGEQSAKSLRGGSMEDVIFAGSATKKTKGMSEVTMVLSDIITNKSNGSGENEKELKNEISVTRRLYRSGESEYLMNKVPCRLKDIKNLFLDTGLELKAYSILEQGRIGDIINSKPQDRRFLIEEVAGVMKYKIRKHEATNKLEASKANLQRLQDIIAEVKRQINTIDRHAKKAERYKKLFEEVKDIELRIAWRDSRQLANEISALAQSEDDLKSKDAEASANVHSTEALIEDKKHMCVEDERSLGEIRTRLYSLEREVAEDEGKIALLKSDCENLRERHDALKGQDSELETQKETSTGLLREQEQREVELGRELEELEEALERERKVCSDSEQVIAEMDADLEHLRGNLFNKAQEISNIKNEISRLNLNIENITRKAEKNSHDINSLHNSLSSLRERIEQTKSEHERYLNELKETRDEKERLAERLKESRAALTSKEETLYREREELAALNSKLESLKEIDRSQMASIDDSIRTLCQVADIFETPQEYERAIEAVLGDKLHAAVVEDKDSITRALGYIREQKSKRSGFITVNPQGSSNTGPDIPEHLKETGGVIGGARQFVSVREGFSEVGDSLLNDVIIVDTLETAFALRDGRNGGYFVTLEGEVVEPSGVVFGGSDKEVLKIKRIIKEIENGIAEKRNVVNEAEAAVAGLREGIVAAENDIISIDGKISGQEKYCHELEVKISNLEEENKRTLQKQEYISLEMDDDHREKESLAAELSEKETNCGSLENEKQRIEEEIRSVQGRISDHREMLEKQRAGHTELKMSLTSAREKMTSIKREIERLNASLVDIDRKREEMINERGRINENIERKETEIGEKEESLKMKVVLGGELQTEASKASEILESRKAELQMIEQRHKSLASDLEKIRSELGHVEMKKMELTMKRDYLKEDIYKTYSVEIEHIEDPGDVAPEDEEKLPQLKEKLKSIGQVSLGTLDEYEELKSRYEFLTKQRDDLLNAIEALEDTIRKINKTSQSKLMDAFNALNEKFKEVFTLLFGKGRAELQLTEGSILDAGIEIVAQPPGKKLQNMNLLSGGEKALTAISLLFAGFMIKPTPLCLLDEVDAPLDESNTDRFTQLLKELAKDIQFITITHNRRTMEAADYMYGITMQEPGSSKVVSMHMSEVV